MSDPDSLWLTVTNMALAGAVAAFIVLVVAGIAADRMKRHRRSTP
jgi:hypothetical protein